MTRATFSYRHRNALLFSAAVMLAAATAFTVALPSSSQAESPVAAQRLQAKPQPPQPGKEVFVRTKPHVNIGPARPKPQGPTSLKGHVPVLHDWYCGEGSGPGGHAVCTDKLINSCSGTYVPPKTNGEHQTWGMCHESSGG
jgi:hypothetical protein